MNRSPRAPISIPRNAGSPLVIRAMTGWRQRTNCSLTKPWRISRRNKAARICPGLATAIPGRLRRMAPPNRLRLHNRYSRGVDTHGDGHRRRDTCRPSTMFSGTAYAFALKLRILAADSDSRSAGALYLLLRCCHEHPSRQSRQSRFRATPRLHQKLKEKPVTPSRSRACGVDHPRH